MIKEFDTMLLESSIASVNKELNSDDTVYLTLYAGQLRAGSGL